jgi:hypothetical protein
LSDFETIEKTVTRLTAAHKAILSALCYADVFNFPLTTDELMANSRFNGNESDLNAILDWLLSENYIQEKDGFFLLAGRDSKSISNRMLRTNTFEQSIVRVKRYSRLVAAFPFVKGVYISGSYSKGQMGEGDDIDYFIITAKGRLWVCRSLLRGFKKFFLRRSEKYFCLNYFLEETHLEVPDKNLFVANEVRTIVPAVNFELYTAFQFANNWTNDFLPNKPYYEKALHSETPPRYFARFLERILSAKFGDWLEQRLFVFMEKRRKRKFNHFNDEEFNLNMRTQKYAEKHHPAGTQFKVLKAYQERMAQFEKD